MMNRTDSELPLLSEEKFDFDLPLSPLSGKEDNEDEDDEVFVGPVGHKEKCVSVNIEMQAELHSEPHTESPVEQLINWSPLTGDKFVEIFKEAHLLVKQFEKIADNSDEASKENIPIRNKNAEQFVEDSDSKLNVFQNVKGTVVSPIKRETFCVQDSPFRILPPAVQQHLKNSTGTSSPLKMHNGTVSPSRKNMRCSLTKKSKKDPCFSYTKQILPSKMIPLKATKEITKAGQLPIAKSKGQKSFSPARRQRNSSDHSSDNISIASDVSDSSQNSSFLGKVTSNSSKIGLKSTALKVPSLQRRSTGVVGQKSSSSSSSVSSINSSMNSSLSVSPLGKSKMNISLNSSLSKPKVKLSGTGNKLVSSLAAGAKLSSSHIKSTAVSKVVKSASASKLNSPMRKQGATIPHTPLDKGLQRLSSVPNLSCSSQKSKAGSTAKIDVCKKPKALVAPTPTGQRKLPGQSEITPFEKTQQILQPKRLLSHSIVPSDLPTGAGNIMESTALQTPKHSSKRLSLISRVRHTSALPTPVSRRASGIPAITPRSLQRTVASSAQLSEIVKSPLSARKQKLSSSQQEDESQLEVQSDSNLQPASDHCFPCSLNFSSEDEKSDACEKNSKVQSEVAPLLDNGALPNTVVQHEKQEVLLIDIEVESKPQVSQTEDVPLIDLSNSPAEVQLIDLSSPLISLSPEEKKNVLESPLIHFTF